MNWIKQALAALFSALTLGLFAYGRHQKGGREEAEQERDLAQRNLKTQAKVQEKSKAVRDNLEQARARNREVEEKRNAAPKDRRRTGRFGSDDFLRDEDPN